MERPPIGDETREAIPRSERSRPDVETKFEGTLDSQSAGSASQLDVNATLAEPHEFVQGREHDDSSLLTAGTAIGHYLVLERLGAGAMGVVYAAYDPRLDRRVAIKLLRGYKRRGNLEASRKRLLREAQALAKLKDPHVVVVHDVGQHDEQVFVAMEYVDGPTLKQWLAEERSVEEILSVFVRAGEGLAAAHRAGLVHRDFKPENVMIDSRGRPRVMDFGLARAADEEDDASGIPSSAIESSAGTDALATPLTQTGVVLGTPAYMAPEQHLGLAADARSDQFAFCIALYEALYGVRPFAGTTVAQLGLAVTSGQIRETPRDRSVPGWIKNVLHRGLSVDAKERYADMGELLAELRDDPAMRRRRGAMLIGGVVLVLGVLAGAWAKGDSTSKVCAGGDAAIEQVWSAGRAAALRKAFGATERSYAESTSDHVVTELDAFAREWATLHHEACVAARVRKERSLELMDRQMSCLERGRSSMRELVERFVDADGKAVDQAINAVGGLPEIAACGDLERVLSGVQPPSGRHAEEVARLRDELAAAAAERSTGAPTLALKRLEASRAAVEATAYEPLAAEYGLEVGRSHLKAGDYAASAAALEQAYVAAVRSKFERVTAEASAELIYVSGYRLARHQAADTWAVNALAWAERVDPTGPLKAHVLHNTAVLLDAQGKDGEAEPLYVEALAIRKRSFGEMHPLVARSTHNLGNIYLSRGDYERAAELYARARDINSEVLGSDHPEVADSLNNLGVAYRRAQRFDDAVEALRRANTIYENTLGARHPDLGLSLDNLALALVGAGQPGEARVMASRSLSIRIEGIGADHPDVGDTRTTLAEIAIAQGEFGEAIGEASLAVTAYQEAFGPKHPQMGIALDVRGRAHLGAGQLDAALRDLEAALAIRRENTSASHDKAETLAALARVQKARGEPEAATASRDEALALFAEAGPAYAPLADALRAELDAP